MMGAMCMRVQCILCDTVTELSDASPEAKKLRNKPLRTYLCTHCHKRISEKTRLRRKSQ